VCIHVHTHTSVRGHTEVRARRTSPRANRTRFLVRLGPVLGLDGDEERRRVRFDGDCAPPARSHPSAGSPAPGGQSKGGKRAQGVLTVALCNVVASSLNGGASSSTHTVVQPIGKEAPEYNDTRTVTQRPVRARWRCPAISYCHPASSYRHPASS
jgi:hypothetical protein